MRAAGFLEDLNTAVDIAVNDYLWTWLMAPLIVVIGVYLTVRSGFVQFRWIPEMFRTITDRSPLDAEGRPQSISAFQALPSRRPREWALATSPASEQRLSSVAPAPSSGCG